MSVLYLYRNLFKRQRLKLALKGFGRKRDSLNRFLEGVVEDAVEDGVGDGREHAEQQRQRVADGRLWTIWRISLGLGLHTKTTVNYVQVCTCK
jgi:hypothetical protein